MASAIPEMSASVGRPLHLELEVQILHLEDLGQERHLLAGECRIEPGTGAE